MAAPVDIQVLEESLLRVRALSDDIDRTLGNLGQYSKRAQQALSPLGARGGKSGQFKAHVDEVVAAIEQLEEHATFLEKAKPGVLAGVSKSSLSTYISNLDDLRALQDELLRSDYRQFHRLLQEARTLQQMGQEKLQEHLSQAVTRCFPPLHAQDYIDGTRALPLPTEDAILDLRATMERLEDSAYSPIVEPTFSSVLSQYLLKTLAFPNQYVKGSGEGSAKLKLYQNFVQNLEQNTLQSLELVFGGQSPKGEVYAGVASSTIGNEYARTSRSVADLAAQKQKASDNDDFAVFESIESVEILGTQDSLPALIEQGVAKLKQIYKNVDQRTRNESVPSEVGISGALVNTLTTMRKLAGFKDGVSRAMRDQPPRFWMASPPPPWASNTSETNVSVLEPLSLYLSDLIECSMVNIQAAAQKAGFTKNPQVGIYALVNLATLEHSIAPSTSNSEALATAVGLHGPLLLNRLQKGAMNMYMEDWKKLAGYLMDVTMSKQTKLSSKDREIVKEKFSKFNAEFEAAVERQKRYNITDSVLRQKLYQEITFLLPLYTRFYEKHRGGDFTKNIEKYIKYDSNQFRAALEALK